MTTRRSGFLEAQRERRAVAEHAWLYRPDRDRTPYPGRWLVVVDTQRTARPAWSPRP